MRRILVKLICVMVIVVPSMAVYVAGQTVIASLDHQETGATMPLVVGLAVIAIVTTYLVSARAARRLFKRLK